MGLGRSRNHDRIDIGQHDITDLGHDGNVRRQLLSQLAATGPSQCANHGAFTSSNDQLVNQPPITIPAGRYLVVADDWLSKLADKYLANPLAYPAITNYTNKKWKEDDSYAKITDSNLIEVGWKIYIPSAAEADAYFAAQATTVGGTGDTVKIGALASLSAPGSVTSTPNSRTIFPVSA